MALSKERVLLVVVTVLLVYKMVVDDVRFKQTTGELTQGEREVVEQLVKKRQNKDKGSVKATSANKGQSLAGFFNLTAEVDGSFRGLSLYDAQMVFAKFCTTKTTTCAEPKRFGRSGDGGYEVCMSAPFTLKPQSCIAYSFGIGKMWDFDDALQQFGCEVHSFDPSIGLKNHERAKNHKFWNIGLWDLDVVNKEGWQLHTLNSLVQKLGHNEKVIDVIKVDIEGAEWPFLKQVLKSNVMKYVKQLIFELHTPVFKNGQMTIKDFASIYNDLAELRDKWNFQLYMDHHTNGCCGRFTILTPVRMIGNPQHLCCYELYFVNNNYL